MEFLEKTSEVQHILATRQNSQSCSL